MKPGKKLIKANLAVIHTAMMLIGLTLCSVSIIHAQGVAISLSGLPPDSSAGLDVNFNNKGLLIPRMTSAQRDAILSPAKGLQIYNLDCDNINCNIGTPSSPNWVPVFASSNIPAAAGSISGSASVCQGQNGVSYSVAAINNATGYVWNYSGTGATITDSTNPVSVNFSASASSGTLTVAGKNACGQGVASPVYSITVNVNQPASVSISASPSGAVSTGTNVTFTATPVNGGNSPAYQWLLNGNNVGSNSPTYASTSLANGDNISCIMTSNAVCATNSPATSNTITMTVNAGPPPPDPEIFSYTGANQTFTIPAGVTQIFLKMWGAGGAGGNNYSSGGSGAYVSGYLAVTPGSAITIVVGGAGIYATSSASVAGGFGGGGASGSGSGGGGGFFAASGGGRSAVQITPGVDAATVGGGGGGGSAAYQTPVYGGGGGGPNGIDGGYSSGGGGGGGNGASTTAGGTPSAGANVNSNNGGCYPIPNCSTTSQYSGSAGASSTFGGGGGGGGYFGGSGGGGFTGSYASNMTVGGGGGGSSYTANLSTVTNTAGNYDNTGTNTYAGWPAPNNADANYVAGVGTGGGYGSNGGNGLVVISW